MNNPRLFAIIANGNNSEKAGEIILNSFFPGLKPGAIEKN